MSAWPSVARGLLCALLYGVPVQGSAQAVSRKVQVEACVRAAYDGQVSLKQARLLSARAQLVACASDDCPIEVREDCAQWLEQTEQLLPSLTVRVVSPAGHDITDATVRVDEATVPMNGHLIELDPGVHSVYVSRPDGQPASQDVVVVAGERGRLVTIALPVLEPAPELTKGSLQLPAPLIERAFVVPAAAWVLGAVGLVAVGSFTTFAIMTGNERAELVERCAPLCSDEQVSAGRSYALIADTSLGLAIGAVAAGVLWTALSQGETRSLPQAGLVPLRNGMAATLSTRF